MNYIMAFLDANLWAFITSITILAGLAWKLYFSNVVKTIATTSAKTAFLPMQQRIVESVKSEFIREHTQLSEAVKQQFIESNTLIESKIRSRFEESKTSFDAHHALKVEVYQDLINILNAYYSNCEVTSPDEKKTPPPCSPTSGND